MQTDHTNPGAMTPTITSPYERHGNQVPLQKSPRRRGEVENKDTLSDDIDPVMSIMTLLPSHFKVLSIDEEDDKIAELEYPIKMSEEDNETMDGIWFMPSIRISEKEIMDRGFGVGEEDDVEREVEVEELGLGRKLGMKYQAADIYHCEVCGAGFEWKTRLLTHMDLHEDGKVRGEGRELDDKNGCQVIDMVNERSEKARKKSSHEHREGVRKTKAQSDDDKLQDRLRRWGEAD